MIEIENSSLTDKILEKLIPNAGYRALGKRVLFSLGILLVYLIGYYIKLPGLISQEEDTTGKSFQDLFNSTMGVTANRMDGIYALGLGPWMIAMMVMVIFQFGSRKSKVSAKKMNTITALLMLVIAVFEAIIRTSYLTDSFVVPGSKLTYVTCVCGMVAGLMFTIWLCEQNEKNGILGKMIVIMVNITRMVFKAITQIFDYIADTDHPIILGIAFVLILMTIIYFSIYANWIEFRMSVKQIMVYNSYAKDSYIAIKFNPVDVMPIMFAMAFYSLFQYLFKGLNRLIGNDFTRFLDNNSTIDTLFGLLFYLFIILVLTIVTCLLTINPKDMAEGMMKSGDCLENLYPGKETKRKIAIVLWTMMLVSTTILLLYIGIFPFIMLGKGLDYNLAMFPATVMMLTMMFDAKINQAKMNVKKINYGAFLKEKYGK